LNILHVAGARPNFMKLAPIVSALERYDHVAQSVVHTGQHYDSRMSRIFFDELCLSEPDYYLGVGSGSHAWQTAQVMLGLEPLLQELSPTVVVVVGDVNSTLAAALVAVRLGIPVAHVEAGLRSFDGSMPEEINRVVTDRVSTFLFTTEESGNRNLRNEGVPEGHIYFVGNTMIDTLSRHLQRAIERHAPQRYGLMEGEYALVTLHRPSNVDEPETLGTIGVALKRIAESMPVVFPTHPRTRSRLREFGLEQSLGRTILLDPLGYLDFLSLMASAHVVLTDSGGVQEETTALGVPCRTLRPNTERPATVWTGTNRLVPLDAEAIVHAALTSAKPERTRLPEWWDGRAAERIARVLAEARDRKPVSPHPHARRTAKPVQLAQP